MIGLALASPLVSMGSPFELFSVVVLGAMNPAIHHPLWYEHVGLLTAQERALALASPDLQITPAFSQFSLPRLTINCMQARWAAQTAEEGAFDRVVEIAKAAMDRLDDTPVSVIGINFDFCRPSGIENVSRALASKVRSSDLGFEGEGEGDGVSGSLSFSHSRFFGTTFGTMLVTTTQTVGPHPTDQSRALVKFNVELRPNAGPTPGYQRFSLAALLDEHVPAAKIQSAKHLERTLAAIRRAEN
ncbi:MAG: hypothetical protein ABSC94_33800 [Polyangiaceae bacterium]